METKVTEQLSKWREEAEGKPLQSAQQVQDRLLDLYGALRAYPIVSQVETWLRITRERSLYEGKEIVEMLDEIELGLALDETPEPAGA